MQEASKLIYYHSLRRLLLVAYVAPEFQVGTNSNNSDIMVDVILSLAEYLSWPYWALGTISLLVFLIIVIVVLQAFVFAEQERWDISGQSSKIPKGFRLFQFQYFLVYFVTMLADWLQGTNMYTLYAVRFSHLSHARIGSANFVSMLHRSLTKWILEPYF